LNDCFNPPRCRVTNSANISINNTTATALTFNTETNDSGGMHSTTSNTSRVTVPSGGDGWYVITGNVEFAANATGQRAIAILLNGTSNIATERAVAASAAANTQLSIATQYPLAAGDYIELTAYQSSGGALNVVATGGSPVLTACWVAVA
jgi:hypothetical protein